MVKAKLSLTERVFTCERCGLVIDRDVNAAKNLFLLAVSGRGPGGAEVREPYEAGLVGTPVRPNWSGGTGHTAMSGEAFAALFALVHGWGGELAPTADLGLESVRLEIERLGCRSRWACTAMGVRAASGAASCGQRADQAARDPGSGTGTVTNGWSQRMVEVGCARVHDGTASVRTGCLIQARPGGRRLAHEALEARAVGVGR
jgi:hypothetical protein